MKQQYSIFFLLCLFSLGLVNAQDLSNEITYVAPTSEPGCIYYAGPSHPDARKIAAPAAIRAKINAGNVPPCSNITVTYTGFTTEAQAAFQYAVDIWAQSIESPQTIRVNAVFQELASGTLGSAGAAGSTTLNSVPGTIPNTFYPLPLAEKLLNINTNTVQPDIIANFNNTVNWYYGTDANPPSGQFDFVSVVLHELGHGLGFFGFGSADFFNGSVRAEPTSGPPALPSVFDNYVENNLGESILSFPDPSPELRTQLTSNNLFCNGPIATGQNAGVFPKLYAPTIFNGGSSYSHWDEDTFAAGNVNSLMTPFIGPGEANHNPGLITLGFFEDMGWSICGGSLTLQDFVSENVSLSPNPFVNRITITIDNSALGDYVIDILDMNGRLVKSHEAEIYTNQYQLDNLSDLNPSLYFVKLTNTATGHSVTKKVIKN